MADLTLTGDIPGLLRRGSPVIEHGAFAVVVEVEDDVGRFRVYDGGSVGDSSRNDCALDLSDPTGRWHAVLWLDAQDYATHMSLVEGATLGMISDARNAARFGRDMTPEQIDTLRRIVLHVAGREVTP